MYLPLTNPDKDILFLRRHIIKALTQIPIIKQTYFNIADIVKLMLSEVYYLEVFRGARQDGAALPPHGALVIFQHPQDCLLVVGIPQQDLQVTLGLPPQLVGEEQAEGSGVGRHHRAHEPGSLLLCLQAGIHVQVTVELWRGGDEREDYFVLL